MRQTIEIQPIRVMRVEMTADTYDQLKHLAINEHCSMAALLGRGVLLVLANASKQEKSA